MNKEPAVICRHVAAQSARFSFLNLSALVPLWPAAAVRFLQSASFNNSSGNLPTVQFGSGSRGEAAPAQIRAPAARHGGTQDYVDSPPELLIQIIEFQQVV